LGKAGDAERHREMPRDAERHREMPKDAERCRETPRDAERHLRCEWLLCCSRYFEYRRPVQEKADLEVLQSVRRTRRSNHGNRLLTRLQVHNLLHRLSASFLTNKNKQLQIGVFKTNEKLVL